MRLSVGYVLALGLLILFVAPSSAFAFWPGFPFSPAPEGTELELPDPSPVNLCVKTVRAAGVTVQVPRPCRKGETPPPPPQIALTFSANPSAIEEGQSSTLTWNSTNATSCEASGGWSGNKSVDGSQSVSPSQTTTYTLLCSGPNGNITKSATVTVTDVPNPPTLKLVKTVVNNNGGQADTDDFQAKIDGANVAWNVAHTVTTGAHTASEVQVFGYTASSWGGDCAADGTVTLAAGENKICTITNDDQAGTLVIKKLVIRDNGGDAATTTFSFKIGDGNATSFEADGQNDVAVNAGTYTITEVAASGYTTTYDNCSGVVVSLGETETCTITNNDIAPSPTTGHLVVNKVTQPSGDTAEFAITASGTGSITGGGAGTVTDATNKDYEVTPGTYSVTETIPDGWVQVSNTCADIEVAAGETENCTITNMKKPKLTVTKVVVNDNEGTKLIADFPLFVDGVGVTSGTQLMYATGTRVVTETNSAGYTAVFSGDCDSNGNVVLAAGDVKNCTITNNDNPPAEGKLLITEVLYDIGAGQGLETNDEWVELFNGTNAEIDLTGYALKDNNGTVGDVLPQGTIIPAGAFLVVVAGATTTDLWDIPEGVNVVIVDGDIGGNGLANGGDRVFLHDAQNSVVDSVSWGTDVTAFDPSVHPSPTADDFPGSSIGRVGNTDDTNAAGDWEEKTTPSPGE